MEPITRQYQVGLFLRLVDRLHSCCLLNILTRDCYVPKTLALH
jgi:hypothetical protein